MADISLRHRVFENLLDNALRYTPDNGHVNIELKNLPDSRISVSVSDNGCGMNQADAQRVFEPRFSSSSGSREANQHAGLGLAIVYSIVKLHESTISVASELGKGTGFTFNLPSPGHANAGETEALA